MIRNSSHLIKSVVYDCTVIGGGPCGIGAMGASLNTFQKHLWIDKNGFEGVGRLSSYYDVPANTPTSCLVKAMRRCELFEFDVDQENRAGRKLVDFEGEECPELGYLVEALEDAKKRVMGREEVDCVHGEVTSLVEGDDGVWEVMVEGGGYLSRRVVLSPGSHPSPPPSTSSSSLEWFNLDEMVSPSRVQSLLASDEDLRAGTWGVRRPFDGMYVFIGWGR